MTHDNSYYFSNKTTVLTLRHNIGERIKGIKIRFVNDLGEAVEYEDAANVGDQLEQDAPARRGLNMSYRNLMIGDQAYNVLIEGLADSNLDTLTVTATVQRVDESGPVELDEPNYEIELLF